MKTMIENDAGRQQTPIANSLIRVVLATAAILMIPLVAMQFTSEVDWKLNDFAIMGVLISGTGFLYVLATRFVRHTQYRVAIGATLALALLLAWAELAVGIFGSPFAGS
jgi:hypothetical protein